MEAGSMPPERPEHAVSGAVNGDPQDEGDRSASAACLSYDGRSARLLLRDEGVEHEIRLRPQGHRLVRHMAERNDAAGGTPVLCSHDELMRAVWDDEPMHTNLELARLVWELRRELRPFGAEQLVESERQRGYRLLTCKERPAPVAPVAAHEELAETVSPTHRASHRPRVAVAAIVLAAVAAAGAVAVLATREGSNGDESAQRTFVDRVENVLTQSAAGRREIGAAIAAGLACSLSPLQAADRIASVADNRQSILLQLGTLQAPTAAAADVLTLLQRALQESIEADRHYRDAFRALPPGSRCPRERNPSFDLAATADARATAAKVRFVRAFNPLAQAAGRPTWSAGRI